MIAFAALLASSATESFATFFSLSESLSLASIAFVFSFAIFSTASNAFSFPTGFTASTASLPIVFALSTVDWS